MEFVEISTFFQFRIKLVPSWLEIVSNSAPHWARRPEERPWRHTTQLVGKKRTEGGLLVPSATCCAPNDAAPSLGFMPEAETCRPRREPGIRLLCISQGLIYPRVLARKSTSSRFQCISIFDHIVHMHFSIWLL